MTQKAIQPINPPRRTESTSTSARFGLSRRRGSVGLSTVSPRSAPYGNNRPAARSATRLNWEICG